MASSRICDFESWSSSSTRRELPKRATKKKKAEHKRKRATAKEKAGEKQAMRHRQSCTPISTSDQCVTSPPPPQDAQDSARPPRPCGLPHGVPLYSPLLTGPMRVGEVDCEQEPYQKRYKSVPPPPQPLDTEDPAGAEDEEMLSDREFKLMMAEIRICRDRFWRELGPI